MFLKAGRYLEYYSTCGIFRVSKKKLYIRIQVFSSKDLSLYFFILTITCIFFFLNMKRPSYAKSYRRNGVHHWMHYAFSALALFYFFNLLTFTGRPLMLPRDRATSYTYIFFFYFNLNFVI